MAEPSIADFLKSLAQSQLLTPAQLETLRKQLANKPTTTEGLAKILVTQKHLTSWQARQLCKGQTGFVLQQYRLLNPIGKGGMGHVFRARAANVDRDVAVKVMARKLTGNETLVSRFRREIRASSKLDSKHIVRTMDAGRVGTVDFMVMEYVNGDQVDRIANRIGRVPAKLACEIVRQIALGLQHAHERKMVHRDIKPANMMVHWEESGIGTAKLMDMGLVLLMADDVHENTVTRAGQVMGTPDYMSPEQGWDTTKVDIRSDIYSLGCTLFRLLTGKIPFTGSNPLQVLSQRLQRDAPSVLTLCDDISADVAAVTQKMTMRDPDARYQTPLEVAEALAPLCESLTLDSLRAATRTANNAADVGVILAEDDSTADKDHEADGSYREFLQEVEEGSVVDLMLATDADINPSVATVPIIKLDIAPKTRAGKTNRTVPNRGQKAGFVSLGIGIVALALIWAVVSSGGRDNPDNHIPDNPDTGDATSVNTPVIAPAATVTKLKTNPATGGEVWTHTLKSKITVAPTSGELQFAVGKAAPVGLTVDPASGVLSWPIPDEQPLGDYSFSVQLVHVDGEHRQVLDDSRLSLVIESPVLDVQLPEPRRADKFADVERPFQLSMAVEGSDAQSANVAYELKGKTPQGISIDSSSGMLTWTPEFEQLGRQPVMVAVVDARSSRVVDTELLSLLVLPTHVKHILPDIPPQTARAGKKFRYSLPTSGLRKDGRIPLSRIIEPGPDAPSGLMISSDGNEIHWQVPQDSVGPVRFSLVGRIAGAALANKTLEGSVIVEVDVVAAEPATSAMSEDEINKALDELRDTYKGTIVQARTTADKALLASRLLQQSLNAKAGVSDAALLTLIEEDLASKARTTDVLLEIARLRAERYGADELAAAKETFKSIRKTGLDQWRQDVIIEQGLRLAESSTGAKDYELTAEILNAVKSLLNRSASGAAATLYSDVTLAEDIAGELAKASDGTVDGIKVEELARLIDRWQFQPIFQESSSNIFVQASSLVQIPRAGRELWTIEDERIRMTSESAATIVGFVDTSQQRDRYVVRFQLSPESNCAQLVFGATRGGPDDLDAHTVVLHPGALGRINSLKNVTPLNDNTGSSQASAFRDIPNLVEVAVDGPVVAVRLNGMPLSKARIPDLANGWLGLAADLRQTDPRLEVKQARILVLPEGL